MKWNEMTTAQKIISVIGWLCGILYFVLMTIDLFDLVHIPRAIVFPLFSVFLAYIGTTQSNKKLARTYYILAAAYVLLALLYILF